jgi:hypothetical protein
VGGGGGALFRLLNNFRSTVFLSTHSVNGEQYRGGGRGEGEGEWDREGEV